MARSYFCWFLSVIHPPVPRFQIRVTLTPVSFSHHKVLLTFFLARCFLCKEKSFARWIAKFLARWILCILFLFSLFCFQFLFCSSSSSSFYHNNPANFQWISMAWGKIHTPLTHNTLQDEESTSISVFSSTLLQNKLSIPSRPILPWSWNTNSSFLYPSLYPLFCTTPHLKSITSPSPAQILADETQVPVPRWNSLPFQPSVFSCFLFWTPICFISWTHLLSWTIGFPGGSEGKASACKAVNLGSISGLGRSPGEGNGNLLRYSCLENPMDGEAW